MTRELRRLLLIGTLAVVATAASGSGQPTGGDFALRARSTQPDEVPAAGGGFALRGAISAGSGARGGGFVLMPPEDACGATGATRGAGSCGCLCPGALFSDGFESGDVSAWSGSAP